MEVKSEWLGGLSFCAIAHWGALPVVELAVSRPPAGTVQDGAHVIGGLGEIEHLRGEVSDYLIAFGTFHIPRGVDTKAEN